MLDPLKNAALKSLLTSGNPEFSHIYAEVEEDLQYVTVKIE
jgi:hypothetical protein